MPNFWKGSHTSQPERFCKYIHRYCNQTRLDGYDYCIRHILEDKTAPFRQCIYVNQPNKKRCTNAAPKTDKSERRDNALCPFHAKRALMKTRISHPKRKPVVEAPAAALKYLEHYCKDPKHDPSYDRDAGLTEKFDTAVCVGGRPSDLEEIESSLDGGSSIVDKAYTESYDDDFSCLEKPADYLEHAGVYTYKEILTIARDKILRLQKMYCDELKVTYHELKEKRRQLLSTIPMSPSASAPESNNMKAPPVNHKLFESLMKHHRCSGVEKILRHRVREKCSLDIKPKANQCIYEKNGSKCTDPALVLTDYCKNHILNDPNQVMFKPCGFGRNCQRPVIPFEEKCACDQHFHLPLSKPNAVESVQPLATNEPIPDPEHFQSMDDIASLGLDDIIPGLLFGLDQFGEPGESTDTVMSEDLMQIQPITLNPPTDILSDSRKSESEE